MEILHREVSPASAQTSTFSATSRSISPSETPSSASTSRVCAPSAWGHTGDRQRRTVVSHRVSDKGYRGTGGALHGRKRIQVLQLRVVRQWRRNPRLPHSRFRRHRDARRLRRFASAAIAVADKAGNVSLMTKARLIRHLCEFRDIERSGQTCRSTHRYGDMSRRSWRGFRIPPD